tara:strand:+ start:12277 stop:12675 length:399 start_codon:yes stop_codon:yes gene_type:complete
MPTLNIVPPTLDIVAYGGDDTTIVFNITDDQGEVYDYIGTHTASIRPSENSATYFNVVINTDTGVAGKAALTVPSEVAAEMVLKATTESIYVGEDLITAPMFVGVWDWQYDNNGEIRTIVRGKITVIGEVTR